MLSRLARRDQVLIAFAAAIFVYLLVLDLGTFWGGCHNPAGQGQAQRYSSYDDCAVNGIRLVISDMAAAVHERRDDLTAISTAFIAIFTIVLALVTGRQARLTRRIAEVGREAAEAARDAASAGITQASELRRAADLTEGSSRHIDRPYLFLRPTSVDFVLVPTTVNAGVDEPITENGIDFGYEIHNYGRTPAILYTLKLDVDYFVIGRQGIELKNPPDTPVYTPVLQSQIVDMDIIGAVDKIDHTTTVIANALFSGTFRNIPLIYGFLRYRDVAGRKYQRGFGFIYTKQDAFMPYKPSYNYDREITDEDT